MDDKVFTYNLEAISHILLIDPDDAKILAKYCDKDKLFKAYKAVENYLIGVVVDIEINKIKDGVVKSFLEALEIDSDSISVDEKKIVLKIIGKVFDLDNIFKMIEEGFKPVELITGGIKIIASIADKYIFLDEWRETMENNAQNGRGTTIVFYYYKYYEGAQRRVSLYKYESKRYNNMASWTPNVESFHGPCYNKSGTNIVTGYLYYDLSEVVDCFFEALEDYSFHNIVSK